jgi:hypothetical protein
MIDTNAQGTPLTRKWTLAWLSFLSFCLALMLAPSLHAQSFGSVVGDVRDSSGAIIPGAKVTLVNTATSEQRVAASNDAGQYNFVNLNPGSYKVTFEKSGFEVLVHDAVTVETGAATRIDGALTVGAVSETVQVSSSALQIQTEDASISQLVAQKTIQDISLNGRNVMNLVALAPGVVGGSGASGNPSGNSNGGSLTNTQGWSNYQIGGAFANQSAVFLDGAPLNVSQTNSSALVPTMDSVQEFRVIQNDVSAEYGRFAGGVVAMTTKGGTNDFHGTIYEYFRNAALNANNFFNNRFGLKRPADNQNQYGVDLGGPIFHNKTFFFFGFEGFSFNLQVPTILTVPTAAMRQGNFTAAGLPKIIDPKTGLQFVGDNGTPNVIPSADLSPAAVNFMNNFWSPPTNSASSNNYTVNQGVGGPQYQYVLRIDHNVSDKNKLFGRFNYWEGDSSAGLPFHNVSVGTAAQWWTNSLVVGDTHIFNSTTILDARVAGLRFVNFSPAPSNGTNYASLLGPGWGHLQSQVSATVYPEALVSGFYNPHFNPQNLYDTNNIITGAVDLTKSLGKHTIKLGGEQRRIEWYYADQTGPGDYTFNTTGTGYSMASFLIGLPATETAYTSRPASQVMPYSALYAVDQWQVTPRLSVNAGIRWEYPGAFDEKHNSASVFLPNVSNALTAPGGMAYPGANTIVNSALYPSRAVYDPHYLDFSPRIGVAVEATQTTSVRAGFSISYLPTDIALNNAPWASSTNTGTTTLVPASNNYGPTAPGSFDDPFPSGFSRPSGPNQAALQSATIGSSVVGEVPKERQPYSEQWNFSVQQQLLHGAIFEVDYVGLHGVHLPMDGNPQLNQLPDQYDSMGTALDTAVTNPFYGNVPASATLGQKSTLAAGQLLRPFPEYFSVVVPAQFIGASDYQGVYVKLEKRWHSAGTFLASYSFSKLLTNTDTVNSTGDTPNVPQDWTNLRAEWSQSSYNVPQRLIVSYVYELPFGKGKHFANGVTGIEDKLVSGWEVDGVTTFQQGFPLFFTSGVASHLNSEFGAGTIRPDVVPGCQKKVSGSAVSRLNHWFNTSCFVAQGTDAGANSLYSFGNESRVDPTLFAQGLDNWDFGLLKNTHAGDKVNIQFRAEFFNIANRVQFNAPGTTYAVGSASFGTVSNGVSSQANNPRFIQFSLRGSF